MAVSLEAGGWRAELDGLLARLGRLFARPSRAGRPGATSRVCSAR
jgi:hypothetical protein